MATDYHLKTQKKLQQKNRSAALDLYLGEAVVQEAVVCYEYADKK